MRTLTTLASVILPMLGAVVASAIETDGKPAVRVTLVKNKGRLVISEQVTNPLKVQIVLLSPNRPALIVDRETCSVTLSTKVEDSPALHGFTPELVALKPESM